MTPCCLLTTICCIRRLHVILLFHPRIHWGLPFLLVFCFAAGLYVPGGVLWGKRTRSEQPQRGSEVGLTYAQSMLRAHPHHRHWVAIWGLVSDGFTISGHGAQRLFGRGGDAPEPLLVPSDSPGPPTAAPDSDKRKTKEGRSKQQSNSNQRQAKEKNSKHSRKSGKSKPQRPVSTH